MPKFELTKIEDPKVSLTAIDLPDVPVPAAAAKPLYAGVGVTDLAVEKVREYVAEVQKSVKAFQAPQPKTLQDKAAAQLTDSRAKFEAKLADLQADAKALPKKVQSRYDENVATVTAKVEGSVAKKAPAKKAPAKKAPAKKTAAKQAPAKKAAAN